MQTKNYSSFNIMRYSELVCNAVQHGVNFDDIMNETRKYHGREFSNRIEKVVKTMIHFG
ncbi:MAG TPA: hypothetical protein PLA65_13335 [Spirochaetota bacterium]|nr:hypothetical protein [Spirochaetota bacterium]HOD15673.1 hypothetical protein [Spirochaetota bacterium]HPG50410.1 hypothetical protein [Spirochaetota bacterium]HPN13040.1 hypothetical protein [Spirochaetota bacterium]